MTILIAEDNVLLAKSIARRFKQCGIATETVGTAAALRIAFRRPAIRALCLDLQLPDGNGLNLLEHEIRKHRHDIPVVIITGTGTDEDRLRAERNGARGFLIKPFALQQLVDLLTVPANDQPGDLNLKRGILP